MDFPGRMVFTYNSGSNLSVRNKFTEVGFQVVTVVSMNMFWSVSMCSLIETDVSKVFTTSIIRTNLPDDEGYKHL